MAAENENNNEQLDQAMLARIDERTLLMLGTMRSISKRLDEKFVTKGEFAPVKRTVYGAVAAVLAAVIGAVVKLVVR